MASAMRIVLCGLEGEELFSGYSVSTLPPPVAPNEADEDDAVDTEREGPSSSGIYLAAPGIMRTEAETPAGEPRSRSAAQR